MVWPEDRTNEILRILGNAGSCVDLDQPGDVIQCPPEALRPGKYYLMGFNPGGGGGKSLRQTTKNLITAREGAPHPLLDNKHMWGNLDALAMRLEGAEWQRRLFITNLFPNASRGVSAWLCTRGGRSQHRVAVECIWPLHQYFLSIVKPRFVIVHGQGAGDSAFRYLWELLVQKECPQADWNATMADETRKDDPSVKSFHRSTLQLGEGRPPANVTFIGIRHLSRSQSKLNVVERLITD